ncbi:MAG: hypothetical protein ILO42_00340 [Clostridia bacterium]|nr:hypothetical protein [Clostridia bacterium]
MIRRICVFAVAVLILITSSCSGRSDTSDNENRFNEGTPVVLSTNCPVYDGILYRGGSFEYQYDRDGKGHFVKAQAATVFRYDLETGTKSCACTDPVCSHGRGSGCVFFGEGGEEFIPIYATRDRLLYLRSDFINNELNTFRVYNLKTGEDSTVFEYENVFSGDGEKSFVTQYGGRAFCGNYVYSVVFGLKSGAKSPDDIEYTLWSYELSTGSRKKIFTTDKFTRIYAASEKRLFFLEYEGSCSEVLGRLHELVPVRFSTDLGGNDRKEETVFNFVPQICSGTKALGLISAENGFQIAVYDVADNKAEVFQAGDTVGSLLVYNNSLVRVLWDGDRLSSGYDWESLKARHKGDIEGLRAEMEEIYKSFRARAKSTLVISDFCPSAVQKELYLPAAFVEPLFISGDYLYADVKQYDTGTGELLEEGTGFRRISLIDGKSLPVISD